MKSYLGGAAPVQNGRAKPQGRSLGERSQGAAVMRRHEEAGSLHLAGWPLSRHDGRVSPSRTKPSGVFSLCSWPTTNAVRRSGETVLHASMPGKWFASPTDEVPQGSRLGAITDFYKAWPKGSRYALAAGTATPWPRPQGCLQSQSRSLPGRGRKAKPQSDSTARTGSRDQLASAKKQSPYARLASANSLASGGVRFPALSAWSPRSRGIALSLMGTTRSREWSGSPGAGNLHAGQI